MSNAENFASRHQKKACEKPCLGARTTLSINQGLRLTCGRIEGCLFFNWSGLELCAPLLNKQGVDERHLHQS